LENETFLDGGLQISFELISRTMNSSVEREPHHSPTTPELRTLVRTLQIELGIAERGSNIA
jgi:hypothetical protein